MYIAFAFDFSKFFAISTACSAVSSDFLVNILLFAEKEQNLQLHLHGARFRENWACVSAFAFERDFEILRASANSWSV